MAENAALRGQLVALQCKVSDFVGSTTAVGCSSSSSIDRNLLYAIRAAHAAMELLVIPAGVEAAKAGVAIAGLAATALDGERVQDLVTNITRTPHALVVRYKTALEIK